MKGLTYFEKGRFSVNEGQFPNIHIDLSIPFFYIAFTHRLKFATDFKNLWQFGARR